MDNQFAVPNPTRQKFKTAAVILIVVAILFAIFAYLIYDVRDKNLNGKTTTSTGVVSVSGDDQNLYLTLDNGENFSTATLSTYYSATEGKSSEEFCNLIKSLDSKTITITYPADNVSSSNIWVLGLACGENVLFDAEKVLVFKQAENKNITSFFVIAASVAAASAVACFVVCIYLEPLKLYSLAEKFAEFFACRQPDLPIRKKATLLSLVPLFAFLLTAIAGAITAELQLKTATIVLLACSAVLFAGGIIAVILTNKRLKTLSIEFYAQNYPFDLFDVSHMSIKKQLKQQLQQELDEERRKYPDRYADGGNGFDCDFTESGLALYVIDEFYVNDQTQNVFEEETALSEQTPLVVLPYDQLNFEALPFFGKNKRPLTVVVKSRLNPDAAYPEELVNDLHFLFDSNLLHTLQKYGVKVENLDEILAGKKELMLAGADKKRK